MIEFNGYLTGASEKYFFKKAATFVQNLFFFAITMILPIIVIFSIKVQNMLILIFYSILFVVVPIMVRIKTKKAKKKVTPKRIYVKDDTIVCVSDTYTESQFIGDVKEVRDFGEFYDLAFPFGKLSDKFVCQKSLLTKGSLKEFEALFEGKIVRRG